MRDEVFDGQLLAEKLSKLNSSQQSIESLSRWCISHRKKAKEIVESWDKLFKSAERERRVSFLYLANDILQNSRRKGSEFVNEFWNFLPAALKTVYGTGNENGKKAASRLVKIWEERKVFGSRGQNLKDEMLGKNPHPAPALVGSGKNLKPIKIVKRDAQSLRIKLAAGAMPEKIISSFHSVHDLNVDEEAALDKFKGTILRTGEIERDVEGIFPQGNLQGSPLVDEIHKQENVLQQCIDQLGNAEVTRAALVSHLKDALRDQEPMLELIHTQLQVAQGQLDKLLNLRGRLTSPPPMRAPETNLPLPPQLTKLPPLPAQPQPQPMMSLSTSKTIEEDDKKAAAAVVAAKLAASTSSAQMLTSILSSLVAEEMSGGGSKSAGLSSLFSLEKRPKLDRPISISDEAANSPYFTSPFPPPAPPPPPPPGPLPSDSLKNQFGQFVGPTMGVMPYGYAGATLPPPPPVPSHIAMGLARLPLPPQQPQSSQSQQQSTNSGGDGYYRPPGFGFYGQSHQSTQPPMPRQ